MCFKDSCIPRIVWAHWTNDYFPEDVDEMVKITRKSLRNFTYCMLNPSNLSRFLDVRSFPIGHNKLHLAGRADYIRVNLLNRYGGVYVDSTTYVNSGVETEWFCFEVESRETQILTFMANNLRDSFLQAFLGVLKIPFLCKDLRKSLITCQTYWLVFNIVEKITVDHSLRMAVQTLSGERNSQRLAFECRSLKSCVRNRLLHDPVARSYPFIKLWHVLRHGKRFHIGEVGYLTGVYNSKKNCKPKKKRSSAIHNPTIRKKTMK